MADVIWLKLARDYIADPIREAASIYDILDYPECGIWRDNVLNVEEAKVLPMTEWPRPFQFLG